MTYGQIRFRVAKEAPGVDLALVDGYLSDRYLSILDRLKWRRLEANVVLETVAPYTTGTVALTNGSNAVTLTGGTFAASMTGLAFAVDGRDEWYEFTYQSATTAILDRGYEGDTDAAASYSVFQSIYTVPADCRIVTQLTRPGFGELGRLSHVGMNASTGQTRTFGPPVQWAPYMDDSGDPPTMQIRLLPIPDAVYSIELAYTAEATAPSATATALLPWIRPSALIAGATADALEHLARKLNDPRYYAAVDRHEARYEQYLGDMIRTEGFERGPQPVKLAGWLTRHNLERAIRSARNRTGPRLP